MCAEIILTIPFVLLGWLSLVLVFGPKENPDW